MESIFFISFAVAVGFIVFFCVASNNTARKIQAKETQVKEEGDAKKLEARKRLTEEYEFSVAGVTFGSRQKKLRTVADYDLKFKSDSDVMGSIAYILKREPDNKHDPNAIAVFVEVEYSKEKANGDYGESKYKNIGMIGYVPAEDAKEIAPKMDAGYVVWVQSGRINEFYAEALQDDILAVKLDVSVEPSREMIKDAIAGGI